MGEQVAIFVRIGFVLGIHSDHHLCGKVKGHLSAVACEIPCLRQVQHAVLFVQHDLVRHVDGVPLSAAGKVCGNDLSVCAVQCAEVHESHITVVILVHLIDVLRQHDVADKGLIVVVPHGCDITFRDMVLVHGGIHDADFVRGLPESILIIIVFHSGRIYAVQVYR